MTDTQKQGHKGHTPGEGGKIFPDDAENVPGRSGYPPKVKKVGKSHPCSATDEACVSEVLLTKVQADRDRLAALNAELDAYLKRIGGCSDAYCVITGRAQGMHTNGGCQHLKEPGQYRTGRTLSAVKQIARAALAPRKE